MNMRDTRGRGYMVVGVVLPLLIGACGRQLPSVPMVVLDATDPALAPPGLGVDVSPSASTSHQISQFTQVGDVRYWDLSIEIDRVVAKVLAGRLGPTGDTVHVIADTSGPMGVRVLFRSRDPSQERLVVTRMLGKGHHDFKVLAPEGTAGPVVQPEIGDRNQGSR